jgi:hypothetical protein
MTRIPDPVIRLLDDLLWRERNLGSGDSREALIGDLSEERELGRSRGWLWWQVGAAIVTALFNTIGQHPYLTLRAVAVGWTTVMVVEGLLRLPFLLRSEFPEWVRQAPFFWVALDAAAFFVSGWVVARVHRQHRLALVLVTMLSMAVTNGIFIFWRTYDILTHPPAYAPLMEQKLLLHNAIPFLLPLLAVNIAIRLLLPLLVAVGGGFHGTGNAAANRSARALR